MKKHVVGRHEELGLHQSYKHFYNQKQLRLGKDLENVGSLSGDRSMDDRIDEADLENNLDFRQQQQMLLGFPFVHPMHDATMDNQLNVNDARENGTIDTK